MDCIETPLDGCTSTEKEAARRLLFGGVGEAGRAIFRRTLRSLGLWPQAGSTCRLLYNCWLLELLLLQLLGTMVTFCIWMLRSDEQTWTVRVLPSSFTRRLHTSVAVATPPIPTSSWRTPAGEAGSVPTRAAGFWTVNAAPPYEIPFRHRRRSGRGHEGHGPLTFQPKLFLKSLLCFWNTIFLRKTFLYHPGDSKIDSGEGILSAILAVCKLRYTGLC